MTVPPLDIDHARLASRFGWRELHGKRDLHTGIDLAAAIGEPVRAVSAGNVVVSAPPGELAGYGNVVVVQHPSRTGNPIFSLYAHMNNRAVDRGQQVVEGQIIGTVGNTSGARGETDAHFLGPHLHFELLTKWPPRGKDQDRIDPSRLWPPAAAAGNRSPAAPKVSTLQPTASFASGVSNLAAAALAWYAWQQYKKQRRRAA
jgi:murein DD-endopeptidase MepM/ murein hydrolase activator NlpD